jgi:GNAT superfamily N-acetyltransferase
VKRTLFADNPAVFGLVCLHGDQPVGFAVYFFNYSTWQGRHGLYLEDLYVTPEARGRAGWRRSRSRRIAAASNGACWTGTCPPSSSTTAWAPCPRRNGSATA